MMELKPRVKNLRKDRGSPKLMWKELTLVSEDGIFTKILVNKKLGRTIAD